MMDSRSRLTALVGSVLLLTMLLVVSAATVSAAAVDLSIEKRVIGLPEFRGFAIAGEELIYEISVRNESANGTAGDVTVTDHLPPQVTYLGDTAGCGVAGQDLTCNLGPMGAWDYRMFQVKVLVNRDAVAEEPDGTGVLVNSASVEAPEDTDGDPSNNTAEFAFLVQDSADLAVVKMSKPDTEVRAGEPFVYTIFVENLGPSWARNVSIRDEIVLEPFVDAEIIGVQSDGTGDICNWQETDWGYTILCNRLEPLAVKNAWSEGRWTIQVTMEGQETQDVNNVVNVFTREGGTPDPDLSNNSAQDFIYVTDVADLSIEKSLVSCDGPLGDCVAGSHAEFHITVWNDGPSTAENVVVEDLLPAGVTVEDVSIVEGSGNCTTGIPGDPFAPLTCNLGPLVNPDGNVISIRVRIDPDYVDAETPGDYRLLENDAWTYSDTFDPDNTLNRDHVIVPIGTYSNVSMWKSGPELAKAGEEIIYNIGVANSGPSTLRGFLFYDNLPPEAEYLGYEFGPGAGSCVYPWSGFHTVLCYLDDMAPGAESHVQIRMAIKPDVMPGTVIRNWIGGYWADSAAYLPEPFPERETEVTAEADLSIVKTSEPMKIYPGEQKVYHIEVTNNGPTIAPQVTVVDTLPISVTYEIDNDNCDLTQQEPDVLECHLGNIMPGETKAFDISALVSRDAPPGEITNHAEVFMGGQGGYLDPNPDNNWAEATNLVLEPTVADLSLEKGWGEAPSNWFDGAPLGPEDCYLYDDSLNLYGLRAGCPLTFTLKVKNAGPLMAENVVVEDVMPAGVTVEGVDSPQGSCTTGIPGDPAAPLTCNLGNIPRDEGAKIMIFARADADLAWEPLENDAVVSSDLPDPDTGNNRSYVLIWVEPFSYLYLNKEGPPEIMAGEQIYYHLRIWNNGPSTAHDVHLDDELPGGVAFMGAQMYEGDGSCVPGTPHCSLGDMEPGDYREVQLWGYVDPWLAGGTVVTNTVRAWADSPFFQPVPNEPISDTVATPVNSAANLSIRKTSDPYKVYAGEQVRYDISVTNNGPSVAYNVVVSDTLDPGVEFEVSTIGCEYHPATMLGSTQPWWFNDEDGNGGALFSIDLGTGAGGLIGQMPEWLAAEIEYNNSTGRLFASMGFNPWYGDGIGPRLYELDPKTAEPLGYVELEELCSLPGLEFVDGTLYGTCSYYRDGDADLYTIDPDTGDMNYVGDTGVGTLIHGLAYDESSGIMYGLEAGEGPNELWEIDLTDGEANWLCDIAEWDDYGQEWDHVYDLRSIEFGPDGQLYGAFSQDSDLVLIDIDYDTCEITHIGDTGFSVTGLTLVEGDEPAVCHLGEIPPGETATFSIWARVKPDTLGMITNRVDVSSDNDPNPDNNFDTEANLVLGKADLKVTKYGKPDGEVRAGEELEYWVVVDNLGPGFAHDVVLYDLISSDGNFELSWFGDSEEYSCQVDNCDCEYDQCWCDHGEAQLTCRLNHPLPVMSPGSSGRWLFKVWVEAYEDQSINNLARVIGSDFDPDLSNNEAIAEHEITAVADLDLHKEAWGEVLVGCDGQTDLWEDEVAAGGMLEYTLNIYNSGPSEAENVVVEDWGLSPFLDIIGVECEKDGEDPGDGCSCNTSELGELGDENRRLVCYLGTIEWTDEDQIRISARIPSDVPEGTRLVNDAKVYSDVFDDDNGGNLASNWTYVTVTADLGVEKSQEPETTLPSLEVVYTIRVDNWGPSDAHGVLISDTLPFTPTTMTVEGCASDDGQCDVPCEVPTCPAGECPWPDVDFVAQANIPAGEHVIYTLTAIPEWVPCEPITNTAEVGFAPGYDDIDPCDCEECEGKDFAYTVSDPECTYVPLALKTYTSPDSPL
jgi:uncharacterized repeat protein (TIGR01451 family)